MKRGRTCNRTSSSDSFPFSDLSRTKMRPAIVLAESGRDDWILCQVTSNPYGDARAIAIVDKDFQNGSLRATSYVRPGKLFTANASLMAETVGTLKKATIKKLIDGVIEILKEGVS